MLSGERRTHSSLDFFGQGSETNTNLAWRIRKLKVQPCEGTAAYFGTVVIPLDVPPTTGEYIAYTHEQISEVPFKTRKNTKT